jgi:beta-glucosidase
MALREKALILTGDGWWNTYKFERLGIPSICMTDGPHGLRKAQGVDITASVPATCFPTASALASSWNTELVERVGSALGRECQTHGVNLLLGPGNNMKRSPLGGRNFEYFSEDPLLSGKVAASHIRGVQSQGVGATLKHYAANNQEHERLGSSSNIDERTLREIYLRAFEIPIREAQPWAVMCAYNLINNVYVSENEWLLTGILRESWGYQGFVVSDWGAVRDRVKGIQAGLNLEMPGSGDYNFKKIIRAVRSNRLSAAKLNESVIQLLAVVLKAWDNRRPPEPFTESRHHQLAREAAGESLVLLKNEGVLPLDPRKVKTIAVIGAFAKLPRYQGAGSSQVNPTRLDIPFDALVNGTNGKCKLTYAPGYDAEGVTSSKLLTEARAVAKKADVVLIFAGLPDSYESEGFDRASLNLPPGHDDLIKTIAQVQPNLVVVLMNGSAVAMPWLDNVKAVLEGWLGGQASGGAIADVLLGAVNPSGKLAETFPKRLEDTPAFPEFPGLNHKADYTEGIFIGYRHYDKRDIQPLFPFGFGLSYTSFAYSNLKIQKTSKGVKVTVTIKNTGNCYGKEIVQVYVRELFPPVTRPERELKAFAKVALKPKELKQVEFILDENAFAYWDVVSHDWIVMGGLYEIMVGSSSRDLRLSQTVELKGKPDYPQLKEDSMLKDFLKHPKGKAYYLALAKASGLVNAIGKRPKGTKLSAQEKANIQKAEKALMSYVNELPVNRIGALSLGKFTDAMLENILRKVRK